VAHSISSYIENIFEPEKLNFIVNKCCGYIKSKFDGVDYIVVRGTSGLLVGSIVAHKLDKRLCLIRKDKELSHANTNIEGFPIRDHMNFVILDDFVQFGTTLREIGQVLKNKAKLCGTSLNCKGYLMYAQNYKSPENKLPFKGKRFEYFSQLD
jgi:orotate phosphoribosyltransferase-like protein